MPEPTVDDVLVAWRDRMADPTKVVKDPANLYEDAAGRGVMYVAPNDPRIACGCMMGNARLAILDLGVPLYEDGQGEGLLDAVEEAVLTFDNPGRRSFTDMLEDDGAEGCARLLDRVIAERRAEATHA